MKTLTKTFLALFLISISTSVDIQATKQKNTQRTALHHRRKTNSSKRTKPLAKKHRNFTCPYCSETFTKREFLLLHRDSCQQESAHPRSIEIKLNPALGPTEELRNFNSLIEVYEAYGIKKKCLAPPALNVTKILRKKLTPDSEQEISETTEKYEYLSTLYTNALQHFNPPLCFFHEQYGDQDEFSIANELLSIARVNDFEEDPIKAIAIDKSVKLSSENAPQFFAMLQKLIDQYGRHNFDKINFSFTMTTKRHYVGVYRSPLLRPPPPSLHDINIDIGIIIFFKHFTNDEIEYIIAHELAHIKCNQFEKMRFILPILKDRIEAKSLNFFAFLDTLNPTWEKEADYEALQITKKTEASITVFLKMAKINKDLLDDLKQQINLTKEETYFLERLEEENPSHPTLHERIAFACSFL